MDLKIGNKVKLYKCNDEFIVEEIDLKNDRKIKVKKLKNNLIAWIDKRMIERII